MIDPVPSPVQALLDLFTTDLAEVRFPDMDGAILARASEEVRSAALAVTEAETALDIARAELLDRQEALLGRAQRALAYARVFAEDDAELLPRLESIVLPRPRRLKSEPEREAVMSEALQQRAPQPRRRGRPRQTRDEGSTFLIGSEPFVTTEVSSENEATLRQLAEREGAPRDRESAETGPVQARSA